MDRRGSARLRVSVDRMAAQLRHAGLRPTRQRVELGRVLFAKGAPPHFRRGPARRGGDGRRPRLARDRLQHAAPVHRGGASARSRDRRHPHLFRHQRQRPPPLLRGRRGEADRHARRRRHRRSARSLPRAWRSSRSKWSSASAASAASTRYTPTFVVIAGLDPAIHSVTLQASSALGMDARIKALA